MGTQKGPKVRSEGFEKFVRKWALRARTWTNIGAPGAGLREEAVGAGGMASTTSSRSGFLMQAFRLLYLSVVELAAGGPE